MLAYFDCFSGISGDMTLAALIDLGVPPRWLQENLTKGLSLTSFELEVGSTVRHGIAACSVKVIVDEDHVSRTYADIKYLIKNSHLPPSIKEKSLAIFKRLAVAESGIHKQPVDKVHFHELGGIDALVDIIGAVLGLDYLGIKNVIASKVPTGGGFVKTSHGKLPIPAPATLEILKGVPIYGNNIDRELVTPTGAAILTEMADYFEPMPVIRVDRIGYGAGQTDLEEIPNLLRVIMGDLVAREDDTLIVVETNIDDMNPEIFGYLMDLLFEDGALDVFWIPIYMKKNRPGTMIQVLCHRHVKDAVIARLLSETTTTGVRFHEMHRQLLEREQVSVQTSFGEVMVKRIKTLDGSIRVVPEYDDCRKIALKNSIPIRMVYEAISRECR
jgi:uncharacterized protein (TIGR00299 family) protein